MKHTRTKLVVTLVLLVGFVGSAGSVERTVGKSPWGPDDEIGRLNLITAESREAILSWISGGTIYDLSVEYFIGMPSWQAAGDPHYRIRDSSSRKVAQ